ncbi:hypothetical protein ACOQFS_20270 [Paracidovorax sp. MALMAid1276]
MKLAIALGLGLFAGWATLSWQGDHLDWLARALCTIDFTLPGIACRYAATAAQFLLVPLAAVAVGFGCWFLLSRNGKSS